MKILLPLLTLALACLPACALRHPAKPAVERLQEDLERSHRDALITATPVSATGSLWIDPEGTSIFSDTRAARSGDLLTVNLVENTHGSQQAGTDLSRDGNLSFKTPALLGWEKRLVAKHPNFNPDQVLETSTQSNYKGDGSTSRTTEVVGAVSARVIGVYPNGNLAVVGHKDVEVNHERQVLTLVGIVRPDDLGPDNSIDSDRLAELYVHLGGRGDIDDQQRQGWLTRLINKVWPF